MNWNKSYTIYVIIGAILLIFSLGIFSHRFDLTEEKRYTLSETSQKVIKNVKSPLKIEVYLEGEFPASFKQLQNETRFMLEDFQKLNNKINFTFIDPIAKKMPQDTLMAMGMEPSVLPDMKDGKVEQIVIFPYAVLKYKGKGISVPLIVQQSGIDGAEQLQKSMEALEYHLTSAIQKITSDIRKNVGIIVNQDELQPDEFQGFLQMASENYTVAPVIPKNENELTAEDLSYLKKIDALVIAKPRKAFTNGEKLVLDQYMMHGGKTLWMMDAVNAEMDTLFHSKKIMAYPYGTNMNDFFFNYGIRINPVLVKDFQKSALIRLVSGEVAGNPQYSSFLWPYFPLGVAENENAITRNINPVKFEFPSSIDTLSRAGIQHKVLFETSPYTTLKSIPNYVALSEIVSTDSIGDMERKTHSKILAVSVEGKFKSAYAQRVERNNIPNFKSESDVNKMVVIADGDIGRNAILKGEPLPLGVDLLTNQQYGNEQFLRNVLDYLLDDHHLMELRNRNIESRLLDRTRINLERKEWQWFNMLVPIIIIAILAGIALYLRKKKFG